jgi:hypothetical protein
MIGHGLKIPSLGIGKRPEKISVWWEISPMGEKRPSVAWIGGDLPTPFLSVHLGLHEEPGQ